MGNLDSAPAPTIANLCDKLRDFLNGMFTANDLSDWAFRFVDLPNFIEAPHGQVVQAFFVPMLYEEGPAFTHTYDRDAYVRLAERVLACLEERSPWTERQSHRCPIDQDPPLNSVLHSVLQNAGVSYDFVDLDFTLEICGESLSVKDVSVKQSP